MSHGLRTFFLFFPCKESTGNNTYAISTTSGQERGEKFENTVFMSGLDKRNVEIKHSDLTESSEKAVVSHNN